MDQAQAESEAGRETVRVPLGVPARLITIGATFQVVVDDLSVDGARITLSKPHQFRSGVLQWLQFECYADVAWQYGLVFGLKFERPIASKALVETCRQAPGLLEQTSERAKAEAWIKGSAGC